MTTDYKPQADSLPGRVLAFFEQNPDEELTVLDVAEKFGANNKNVHTQLSLAIDHRRLVRDRNVDGEYVYKLAGNGVNIDRAHTPRIPLPQNPFAAKPQSLRGKYKEKTINFDALVVEDNVPVATGGSKGTNKWMPLFSKLQKPGQSIAFTNDVKTAVQAAALKLNRDKQHGARYRVATIDQTTARVWRIA